MKDFKLTRPFFEFAIKNPGSLATREIMGVRIGAASAQGPLSITSMTSFSGYLTAKANLTMQGQTDMAVTCGSNTAPCIGESQSGAGAGNYWLGGYGPANTNGVNNWNFQVPNNSLGLNDDRACSSVWLGGYPCVAFSQTRVSYGSASRTGLDVIASGNRQTQSFIQGATLATLVDEVTNTLSLTQPSTISWLSGILIPLVKPSMRAVMKQQLADGLGIPLANLNTYDVPYNVSNVHQININSDAFGFTVQKENVVYPGFVSGAVATRGWAMYLPQAFTLDISQPLSVFVSNIVNNTNAKDGNIVALPNAYRNCWGTLTFC